MKLTLEGVLRKVANPPAPQNWVRLIAPNDVQHTAKNIANFALGIPEFNYVIGSKMCHDRVRNQLDLVTALKACAKSGAPAGRMQNAGRPDARIVGALYKNRRSSNKINENRCLARALHGGSTDELAVSCFVFGGKK